MLVNLRVQSQILSCFRVTESVIPELWKPANYPIVNSGYFRRLRPRGGRPKLLRGEGQRHDSRTRESQRGDRHDQLSHA